MIGADRQRFCPSFVLLKCVPQGRTESGGIVLAANAGPRVPSGGVTLKRRCTYRPSVIYLIANKLSNTEREREREREKREGERRVCVSRRRQARVHASCSLCGGCPPRTSPRTCKSARQRCSASSTNIQLVLLGVNISLSHPCPYSPPPPPPCLRFLVARSIRSSPLLLSPPSPYSCHPYPLYQDTCITGI